MPNETPKHPLKSKTIWGLIVMILGALAAALGYAGADFQFLADGWQLEDLGALAVLVGYLLKEYGQRAAKRDLTTLSGHRRRR